MIRSLGVSKKLEARPPAPPGPEGKSKPVRLRSLRPPLLIGWG